MSTGVIYLPIKPPRNAFPTEPEKSLRDLAREMGIEIRSVFYEDGASFKPLCERAKLREAIASLNPGDTLFSDAPNLLAREMGDLSQIFKMLTAHQANLYFATTGLMDLKKMSLQVTLLEEFAKTEIMRIQIDSIFEGE